MTKCGIALRFTIPDEDPPYEGEEYVIHFDGMVSPTCRNPKLKWNINYKIGNDPNKDINGSIDLDPNSEYSEEVKIRIPKGTSGKIMTVKGKVECDDSGGCGQEQEITQITEITPP